MSEKKVTQRKHQKRFRDRDVALRTVLEMIDNDPEIREMANRNVSFVTIMQQARVRDRIIYNRNLRAKLAESSSTDGQSN
jgi:hypothetical protein